MDIQNASDEYLAYLQIEKNASPNTLRSYAYDLLVYREFMLKTYPGARTYQSGHDKFAPVYSGSSDQSANEATNPSAVDFLLKITEADFMAGVVAPKADKKLPVHMRQAKLQQLMLHLESQDSSHAQRDELIVKVFTTTGLRRQEMVDLTWQQFDLDACTI